MVIETPIGDRKPGIFVHGAQVLVAWVHIDGDWSVQTFDFSRWGHHHRHFGMAGAVKPRGVRYL